MDDYTVVTKMDYVIQNTIKKILKYGKPDLNPRPKYLDGKPAHTISINHISNFFNFYKGDSVITTLRLTAIKSAIGEILWIYQDASNDLDMLKDRYGVTWWDQWEVGSTRTIGCCYGETIRRHNLMENLLKDIEKDPDGRRHIINMWQEDDFKNPHGLKPCCYQTVWNIRHEKNRDYIDMCLFQRSSDFVVSGPVNILQYAALLYMVCGHFRNLYKDHRRYYPGVLTWFIANAHIYDRHINACKDIIKREPIKMPIEKQPTIVVPDKNFYDYKVSDIEIINYPKEDIKNINPQIKFELAI